MTEQQETEGVSSRGIELIAAERARQPELGYDAEHDKGHARELTAAGAAYAAQTDWMMRWGTEGDMTLGHYQTAIPMQWPWGREGWRFTGDPIRDLTKAGALIAAALDSLLAEQDA